MVSGPYYNGQKNIWQKTELKKAVAVLLTLITDTKVTMKYIQSNFVKNMSFVEFAMNLYGKE